MLRVAPRPAGAMPLRPYSTSGRGRGEGGRKMLEDQLGFKGAAPPPRAQPPPRPALSALSAGAPSLGRGRGAAPPSAAADRRPLRPPTTEPAAPAAPLPAGVTPSVQAQAVVPGPGGRGRGMLAPPPPSAPFGRGRAAAAPPAPGQESGEEMAEAFRPRPPRRSAQGRFSASGRIGDLGSKRLEDVRARERPEADAKLGDTEEVGDDLLENISRGDAAMKWRAKLQTKIKREAVAERQAEGVVRGAGRGKGRSAAAGAAARSKEKAKDEADRTEAGDTEDDLLALQAVDDGDIAEGSLDAATRFMPIESQGPPSPLPGPMSYIMDVVAPAISRTLIHAAREDEGEQQQKQEEEEKEKAVEDEEGEKKKDPPPEFRVGIIYREERAQDLLFKLAGKKELFSAMAIAESRAAKRRAHYRKLFDEFLPTATPEQKAERRRGVRAKLREMKAAKKAKKKSAAPAVPVKKGSRLRRSKRKEKPVGRRKYSALGWMGSLWERMSEEIDEYDDEAIAKALTMMERGVAHNPYWTDAQRQLMMQRTKVEFELLTRKSLEKEESREQLTKWLFHRHWAKWPARKSFKQAIKKPYSGART